jgi:hypothetical protein
MMNVNHMNFNYTDTFSSSDIETGAGYKLGDRVETPNGIFVLTEANGDLTKGMILTDVLLYATDAVTYSATALTLTIADAGSTVAQGRLAGQLIHFDDDANDIGDAVYVKGNTAGASGSAMVISLFAAITTPGASLDITVYDPNYVKKTAASTVLQRVVGVCPTTVTQATAPYFWRQVSGLAPVLTGGTGAANRKLDAGDDTAGSAGESTTTAADDVNCFATVVSPSPAADKLCVARINGILS